MKLTLVQKYRLMTPPSSVIPDNATAERSLLPYGYCGRLVLKLSQRLEREVLLRWCTLVTPATLEVEAEESYVPGHLAI